LEIETQWHLLAHCTVTGIILIRRKYSIKQQELMEKFGIRKAARLAIAGNIGILDDGTYPDIRAPQFVWQYDSHPATIALKNGCNLGINWFQRGPLPADFVADSWRVLGIAVDQAVLFCAKWMSLKWKEGMAIWRKRNDMAHDGNSTENPLYELRSKVRATVLHRREVGAATPADADLRRMGRAQLDRFVNSDIDRHMRGSILSSSMFSTADANGQQVSNVAQDRGHAWFSQERERMALAVSRIRRERFSTRHQGAQRSAMSMPIMLAAQSPRNLNTGASSSHSAASTGSSSPRRFSQSRLNFEVEGEDAAST